MKRKVASIGLLVLVATMIIGTMPNTINAISDPDSMVRIASKAKEQIRIQLSEMDNVSDEIKRLYEQGSRYVESLTESVKRDDVSTSREQFLSAMKIFKEITQKISPRTTQSTDVESQTSTATTTTATELNLQRSQLDRMERYIKNLKEIAIRHNANVDFLTIEKLFEKTRNEIDNGNLVEAKTTIDELKQLTADINKTIHEKASQKTNTRAKSFAEKYTAFLNNLIAQAKELGVSADIINKLEQAKKKLSTASDPDQIIKEIKHIISIKDQFEITKADRIESRLNQLESKLDRLATEVDSNNPTLGQAKDIVTQLKDLISQKNFEDVLKLLRTLNGLVEELENSYS